MPEARRAAGIQRSWVQGEAIGREIQGPEGSELWFFDALDIAKGPIAKARHDELAFGFTLHSAWLPSLTPPEALYMRSVIDELSGRFSFLDQDARALAESVLQRQFL